MREGKWDKENDIRIRRDKEKEIIKRDKEKEIRKKR